MSEPGVLQGDLACLTGTRAMCGFTHRGTGDIVAVDLDGTGGSGYRPTRILVRAYHCTLSPLRGVALPAPDHAAMAVHCVRQRERERAWKGQQRSSSPALLQVRWHLCSASCRLLSLAEGTAFFRKSAAPLARRGFYSFT